MLTIGRIDTGIVILETALTFELLIGHQHVIYLLTRIGVRAGGRGGGVDPPIRADMTFIRAKDKTFVRDHSGKTGFGPPNGCWPVRRC